ncbi:hypothetical protein C4552_00340 [Candidatus Parcubacteria bacterium]|nr:MAG: hypothetical protein C4552_00340 [Candidatus Parcubacteria bacterium]
MPEIQWDDNRIREGFVRFFSEFGRYPTVLDIDSYDYLPSSKQLQRKYGGVKKLRELLGLDITDFTSGEVRSQMVSRIGKRALKVENDVRNKLIAHFGEFFVHEQRPHKLDSRSRLDFFVYHRDGEFGVDVFYAENRHSFVGCINQKERMYRDTKIEVFLVYESEKVGPDDVDEFLMHKKHRLAAQLKITDSINFHKAIQEYHPLKIVRED